MNSAINGFSNAEMPIENLACNLVECAYIKMMKRKQAYVNLDDYALRKAILPCGWIASRNYELKLKFLNVALSEEINLCDIEGSYIFNEGVYNKEAETEK